MLESVWFFLWGFLWAIYFALDGFDLGLGAAMPLLASDDNERRVILNSIGPFWDGNEVWLITAGGVTFAAFPTAYAVMFSALYSPLLLILFGLILRGVSIEFRGKLDSGLWKRVWDSCMVAGSSLSTFLFGVTFANIFRGIPIDADGVYHGSLLSLFNPYGLAGGLLFLALFLVHGSLWLVIKSEADLRGRAALMARGVWPVLSFVVLLFVTGTLFATSLCENYLGNRLLFAVPLAALGSLVATRIFIQMKMWWKAWFASGLTICGIILSGFAGLYPNLVPSALDASFNVTVYNSASNPVTLKIMLAVTMVFIPVVIIYQAWVYRLFKDKVTHNDLAY